VSDTITSRREVHVVVLVLNASYEPLHTVSVPHAVRMLVRKVAEIHEAETTATFGRYPLPRVVRLVRYAPTAAARPTPSTTSPRSRAAVRARAG
jgi:hypothetical protein